MSATPPGTDILGSTGYVRKVPTADQFPRQSDRQSGDCRSGFFYPEDEITRVGLAIRLPRQRGLEAQSFVETRRGCQDFVARQAYLSVSRSNAELVHFLYNLTSAPSPS